MMNLVALAQPAQDRDGVLDRGLIDRHRLETPFQSSVLFDVFPILVEGGGADAVQLAARQHGLEQVAGIHRTLGSAGADDGMQLVDEQNDFAGGILHFLQHRLEALLELAAELGAGDQRAHVQRDESPFLESFGDILGDDALCQAFDDGRLADAGLADEHRVVLGAARQDLNDAPDLFVATDHRIELPLPRQLGQVASIALESLVGVFGRGAGDALTAADLLQGGEEVFATHSLITQQLAGGPVVVQRRDHEVLDADVLVLELSGFVLGALQQLAQALCDEDLIGASARAADLRDSFERRLDGARERCDVDSGGLQQGAGDTVGRFDQGAHEVLDIDSLMLGSRGPRLRVAQRLLRSFRQPIQIHQPSVERAISAGMRTG